MVRFVVLAALVMVPACILEEDDDEIPPPAEQCNLDRLCVTPDNPFRFAPIPFFGVGTEMPLKFMAHTSLHGNFEIVASDPSIEIVNHPPTAPGTFEIVAATGGTTVTASVLAR